MSGAALQLDVLLVDDDPIVRKNYGAELRAEGCTVTVAADGDEALHAAWDRKFDVVLLDLRMPDMDGITVLRALKQRWPESEVIIITGYPTLESAKEAVALGAYDYLTKPVGPEQVIDASNAAMQHKRWALHNDTGAGGANVMARGS